MNYMFSAMHLLCHRRYIFLPFSNNLSCSGILASTILFVTIISPFSRVLILIVCLATHNELLKYIMRWYPLYSRLNDIVMKFTFTSLYSPCSIITPIINNPIFIIFKVAILILLFLCVFVFFIVYFPLSSLKQSMSIIAITTIAPIVSSMIIQYK